MLHYFIYYGFRLEVEVCLISCRSHLDERSKHGLFDHGLCRQGLSHCLHLFLFYHDLPSVRRCLLAYLLLALLSGLLGVG